MNDTEEKLQTLQAIKGKLINYNVIVRTLANKIFANKEISLAKEQFICEIFKI
jgi:hypothetical protein